MSCKGRSGPSFVRTKFCPMCDNILYPKEDETVRQLAWSCMMCSYQEAADHPYIYITVSEKETNELDKILTDCIGDPTLPRAAIKCLKCGHNEAVYFESDSKKAENLMKLYYVCTNALCRNKWTQ